MPAAVSQEGLGPIVRSADELAIFVGWVMQNIEGLCDRGTLALISEELGRQVLKEWIDVKYDRCR